MKHVIITGASRGIGAALAKEFLSSGYALKNFSRSRPEFTHPNFTHYTCDLSQLEQALEKWEKALEQILEKVANELIVILNAAILEPVSMIGNLDSELISKAYAINLISPVQFTNVLIERFQDLSIKKRVVFVGSGAGNRAIEGWSVYGGSKAGLHHFVQSCALEQKNQTHPFICNLFDPGRTDTAMQKEIRNANKEDFPLTDDFKWAYENGMLNNPEILAERLVKVIQNNKFGQGEVISHRMLK